MALLMMMNLYFCMISMYRKTPTFRTIRTHLLSQKVWQSRDVRNLKEVLLVPETIICSQRSVCDGLECLHTAKAAFIPMQIWRYDP